MFLHFVLLFNGKETEEPNGRRKGKGKGVNACYCILLSVRGKQQININSIKNLNAKIDISIFFSIWDIFDQAAEKQRK